MANAATDNNTFIVRYRQRLNVPAHTTQDAAQTADMEIGLEPATRWTQRLWAWTKRRYCFLCLGLVVLAVTYVIIFGAIMFGIVQRAEKRFGEDRFWAHVQDDETFDWWMTDELQRMGVWHLML